MLALRACQTLHCPERSPRPHSAATRCGCSPWQPVPSQKQVVSRGRREAGNEGREQPPPRGKQGPAVESHVVGYCKCHAKDLRMTSPLAERNDGQGD